MASITGNGSKGHHKFILTVTESATSTENNTSTVKFTLQIAPIQTSWNWEQWGSSIGYTITINGSKYTGSIPAYDGYSTVTLRSGTQSVAHNADGSKSISYSFSVTDTSGQSYTCGNASASGTLALTTIARATAPTLSATSVVANDSNSITINIAPASSTFKHKVRYDFGALTGQTSGISIGSDFTARGNTSVTFKPPSSLCGQIPNDKSGTLKILLYTYTSSGTHIGTKSVTCTLTVPTYTPTISNVSLAGNNLLSSDYVQDKSTVTVNITASTSYGATIKTYSTAVDGKTYTSSSFTTSVLSNGSKTVVVTVTDTRGYAASYTSSAFTVYAYASPSVTGFTLERQDDGTTVIATVKGSVSAVNNKNAKTIKVTLNGVTNTITSSAYTINGTTTFTNIPTDNTFTGKVTITDSYTSANKEAVLPTVEVTMDFHYSGKGVAFGKVAELASLLEVAWKSKFHKAMEIKDDILATLTLKRNHTYNGAAIKFQNDTDVLGYIGMYGNAVDRPIRRWKSDTSESYIVLDTGNLTDHIKDYVTARGTSSGWEYTKWNSGKIELFAEKSLSFPAGTKQTDYLYRSIVSIDLSSLLTNIMSGTCCIQTNGMVPLVCRHSSTLTTAEIVIVTSRTFSAFTITAPIYIVGKWK